MEKGPECPEKAKACGQTIQTISIKKIWQKIKNKFRVFRKNFDKSGRNAAKMFPKAKNRDCRKTVPERVIVFCWIEMRSCRNQNWIVLVGSVKEQIWAVAFFSQ